MVEERSKTHLALICEYLQSKYNLHETNTKILNDAQKAVLYNEISMKTNHKKLYKFQENPLANMKDSSVWLKHGNNPPQLEAKLCLLQDRNIFGGETGMCHHCRGAAKTVDHLATKCDRMLASSYTRRHNEVLKCLHMLVCNKYGLKMSKRIGSHSVQQITENEQAEVRVDTRIRGSIQVKHNRPDIFIYDK